MRCFHHLCTLFWEEGVHWWPREKTAGEMALGGATGNKQVREKAIARQLCAAEGRKHMCIVLGLPAKVFRNLRG